MGRQLTGLAPALLGALLAALASAVAAPPEAATVLGAAGEAAFEAGRYEEALQSWQAAAAACDEAGQERARYLQSAARACGKLGRRDAEIHLSLRALELHRRLGNDRERAGCHYDLGLTYYETDDYSGAATHFRAAMELYAGLGMQREQADSASNLGIACDLLDLYQEAVRHQTDALGIYTELKLEHQIADAWMNLGTAHYNLGRYEQAIEYENMALEVYRRLGQDAKAAACLMMLGAAYDDLGLSERGVEHSRRALLMFESLGDVRKVAQCTANIGVAYYLLGRYGEAVEQYVRALETYRELGLSHQEANCTENLASAHAALGEFGRALELHEQALKLYERLGVKSQQARCWSNLAAEYQTLGRHQEALAALEQASWMYRAFARSAVTSGRPWLPAPMYVVEGIYGEVYFSRDQEGDLYRAYRHFARAIAIVESLRDRGAGSTELRTSYFGRMSWVYDRMVSLLLEIKRRNLGVDETALQEQEPGYWEELGLPPSPLWAGWSDYDEALVHYSDRSRARVLQELLANRQVALADPRTAGLYRDWTELSAQERGLERHLAVAPAETVAQMGTQLAAVTQRRRRVQSELDATPWGQVVAPGPARLPRVRELLAPDEAVLVYKLLPDQVAIMVVPPAGADCGVLSVAVPTAAGEQRPLWGRGQALRGDVVLRRLRQLAGEPDRLPSGPAVETPVEPDVLRANFSVAELVWLLRESLAAYGRSSGAADVTRRAQQAYAGAALYDLLLRPVEALLDRLGLSSLIVVPDGALCYLPFGALPRHAPPELDLTEAGQVYANPRLQYALEKWRLSTLPSLAMYMSVREAAAPPAAHPPRLCVFADPVFAPPTEARRATGRGTAAESDTEPHGARSTTGPATVLSRLPHTRKEALAALAGFGGGPESLCSEPAAVSWGHNVALLGAAAQEPLAYGEHLRRYSHILFSTHGVIDPVHPELSHIALSSPAALGLQNPSPTSDGRLTMPEAFGLRLNARMVTLSACRTAEGDYQRGEGILGLTAAMFVSGARAVTATLWSVDDAATARLVGDYHRRLGAGEPAAEALRAAQLGMLLQARRAFAGDPTAGPVAYANPYYWAPFALIGQWRG